MTDTSVVVVGGGVAAATFAQAYRDAGGDEVVTILSAERELPYHRPPLSKALLRGEASTEDVLVHGARWYEEEVIDVRPGTTVTAVDPVGRDVLTGRGEHVPYGTLVLATGARPRALLVDGADLIGVHQFRTIEDAWAVRDAEPTRTLVVGASFIGCEVATSLRATGRPVTIVSPTDTVMPKLHSAELSGQLVDLLRDHGVEVVLGEQVTELRGNGRLLVGAHTSAGRDIEAFLAIVGIGVEPHSELLEQAGATVEDGVVVDEGFRSSLDGVYAIGDVARFPEPVSGQVRRIEHWSNAVAHGRRLGRLLAGDDSPYDEVPVFFTQIFDLKLQVLGEPRPLDTCRLTGSVAERKLFGTYLRDGVLVGAILTGYGSDVAAELTRLIRERAELADSLDLVPDATRLRALAN